MEASGAGPPSLLHQLVEAAPGRVRLAATMLYRGEDRRRLAARQRLAQKTGVPLIAINDVLYHAPERRPLHDVLTCIREHLTLDGAGRRLAVNAERYLKSPAEMARLFRDAPAAIAETEKLARQLANTMVIGSAPDIVDLALEAKVPLAEAAGVYFGIGDKLRVLWLLSSIIGLNVQGGWQALARSNLRDDTYRLHRLIAARVLQTPGKTAEERIEGLEIGVDDYVAKPFEPRELLLRLHNILRRGRGPSGPREEITMGDFTFHIGRGELRRGEESIKPISPSTPPGPTFSTSVPLTRSSTSPSCTTNIVLPDSPWLKMRWPRS